MPLLLILATGFNICILVPLYVIRLLDVFHLRLGRQINLMFAMANLTLTIVYKCAIMKYHSSLHSKIYLSPAF